jgi:predicted nucleotidyltransferase
MEAGTYTLGMRLTPKEQMTIRETVLALAGPGSRVRLFGSRVDDLALGGDIDLLVEVDHAVAQPTLFSARIGAQLQQALGDRRIDVVLAAPNLRDQAVHRVARKTGIPL